MDARFLLAMAAAGGLLLCPGIGGCAEPAVTVPTSTGALSPADASATRPRASDAARRYDLDSLPRTEVGINGHTFRVWLVQEFDPARPDVQAEGLMHVPSGEIADDEGMLFVFSAERIRGFWMKNTIAPLDIAFARLDGTIVAIWQMPPLTLQTFSSLEPAIFALEVKQGTLARLGIREGDRLEVPADVFEVRP